MLERAFLLALASGPYIDRWAKGTVKELIGPLVNFQYERQRQLLQPDGTGTPLTYADGTPAISRERAGDVAWPVDAGDDYVTQPNSRAYLRVRKAEAILKKYKIPAEYLQLTPEGAMKPELLRICRKLKIDPVDLTVTSNGLMMRDLVNKMPVWAGHLADQSMRGFARYVRELPGFFSAMAGFGRGLYHLAAKHEIVSMGSYGEAADKLQSTLGAVGEVNGIPKALKGLSDLIEEAAAYPPFYRAFYDLRRMFKVSDGKRQFALGFNAIAQLYGMLFKGDEARYVRMAGEIGIGLTTLRDTSTKALRWVGTARGYLRVAQAVAQAEYPAIRKHIDPATLSGRAKGFLNIANALLLRDRGIYTPMDDGDSPIHDLADPASATAMRKGRPWIRTLNKIYEGHRGKAETFDKVIHRTADHPAPDGLFADWMRIAKAACMDRDSWHALNSIAAGFLEFAPEGWRVGGMDLFMTAVKASAGLKNPYGRRFQSYSGMNNDRFEIEHGFMADKRGTVDKWAGREQPMMMKMLRALYMRIVHREQVLKEKNIDAPDNRPPRPGERITTTQNSYLPVSVWYGFREGLRAFLGDGADQEKGWDPEASRINSITQLFRMAMHILGRRFEVHRKDETATAIRTVADIPYHALTSVFTLT